MLGKLCFESCVQFELITFEHESRLMRIEKLCFSGCPLESICIPRNVDFIDGSAFVHSECQSISVDPNNRRFSIDQDFLIDNDNQRLVRYIGTSNRIHVWNDIEILGIDCCHGCGIKSITFGSESRLKRIEESCFASCSFK
jgi:hypothetical protein